MYQVQGKGERVVAMLLKELPAPSEGNPLLTVTTKLVREQQESRPLLSPSIDDFLSEIRSDAPSSRPLTSNTAARLVLQSGPIMARSAAPDRPSEMSVRLSHC
ncbi:PEX5-related protein-like [Cottoperca gobio]|uniref:PEX5-related protein-like n=1 Tax=Cottoperca gobio TaxID=56716 RepID=A0A6J2RG88_COTGO|nr:PEX5-related protein-like [Cottoperca gobio]